MTDALVKCSGTLVLFCRIPETAAEVEATYFITQQEHGPSTVKRLKTFYPPYIFKL